MQRGMVLILAGGRWGGSSRLSELASNAGLTIAVDGGWAQARQRGIPVDLVVGDLDSLGSGEREALLASSVRVHSHPHDKDQTDLELAIDHALSQSPDRIVVFGAAGGRLDHAVANVFLLEKGEAAGVRIELASDDETAWLATASHEVPCARVGDRVSLLPITASAEVETIGLRYPLNRERLNRASSRGVSNEVSDLPARIHVTSGKVLVVHGRGRQPEDT
jgi:thiamine pyrophosphokinase